MHTHPLEGPVARLRKQNRITWAALGLVAAAAIGLGATAHTRSLHADIITAQEFRVVDENAKSRIVLSAIGGLPRVTLSDEQGRLVFELLHNHETGRTNIYIGSTITQDQVFITSAKKHDQVLGSHIIIHRDMDTTLWSTPIYSARPTPTPAPAPALPGRGSSGSPRSD